MAAFLLCLLVSLSALFKHRAEAIKNPLVDLNRVLLSYNSGYDLCKEITDYSGPESKKAADEGCELAFRALDQLGENSCRGWRHAECRLVSGENQRQCTCIISYCDNVSVRSNKVMPFRDCASVFWAQELATQEVPVPTADFLLRRNQYDAYWQAAKAAQAAHAAQLRAHSLYNRFTFQAGTSGGANASGGASSSGGMYASGETSRSTAAYSAYTAKISSRAHTSSYGYPRAKYSHAPGVSFKGAPDPAGGGSNKNVCDQCGNRLRSERALLTHRKTYHAVDDTRCHLCNINYKYQKAFSNHIREKHPKIAAEKAAKFRGVHIADSGPEIKPFACGNCERAYSTPKSLKDHKKTHSSLATYCIFCDATLASKTSYRTHLRRRHPDWATAESANDIAQYAQEHPEKCEQCPKRFKNERGLREHNAVHEGKTKCDECGDIFTRTSYLAAHKRKDHPK